MELSIILPGIRRENWATVINSIDVHHEWEVILCSPPCDLPDQLKNCDRLVHIVDKGSPVRASCIAAERARGKYFTWTADDCTYFPGVLDKVIDILNNSNNVKKIVATKYYEGGNLESDDYYLLNNAYPKSPYNKGGWRILNCGVMHTEYYRYLGGWDCEFETTALSHADLAFRTQMDDAEVFFLPEALVDCAHGHADHGPIEAAHVQHDWGFYEKIYNSPDCINRIRVDPDNWKKAPAVWTRRFSS